MINSSQKDRVIAVLTKHGLKEQVMAKGLFIGESNIATDLRGKGPVVGVMIGGIIHATGHGVSRVQDIQSEVEAAMKYLQSKSSASEQKGSNPASGGISKAPEPRIGMETVKDTKLGNEAMKGAIPSESKLGAGGTTAKKGTTTAACAGCSTKLMGTIDEFATLQEKYGQIYCRVCIETGKHETKTPEASKDQKVAGNVPATPAKTPAKIIVCGVCGIEIPVQRVLDCKDEGIPVTCKGCEGKHDEKKHQEAQKGKDAQAEERKARPEEPKRAEVVRTIHQPDALLPIKTYTPQGSIIKGFVPSLKEIGKIKIGRKSNKTTPSGHRLPEKIDHFEIVGLMRDEHGNFPLDPIMKTLGESPKELNIFLLYNDLTLNFPTRYNAYKGGKCLCYGDGVTATTINGDEVLCNPETCQTFKDKGCKVNGILSCVLADSPTLGGVYKLRTGSFYSVRSILSSLMYISTLTGGILSMIPLKLTVTPMQVTPNGQNQTVYIVNVVFPGTMQNLLEATVKVSQYQLGMRAQIQQLEATAKMALAQPESEEEQKEYQDEFMPEVK